VTNAVIGFLRDIVLGRDTDPDAGLGQSMAEDISYFLRFRHCRRFGAVWHAPDKDEAARLEAEPVIGRFGGMTIAIAGIQGRL